jgi:Ca2+-binding RTX toxin-like protein
MRSRLALVCVVMLMGVLLVGGVAVAKGFRGTSGPDEIVGTKNADTIRGLGGNDRLLGSAGPDEIYGGGGRDTIRGGNGDDRLMAVDGRRDTTYCGDGTDFVYADPDPNGPNTLDTVYYGCETVKIERSR